MDIEKGLSEILAILQNEERSVEISGDGDGLRVYFEEGTSLVLVNLVARILKEVMDIEEHELTLHKDEDSGRIYLLWVWEGSES